MKDKDYIKDLFSAKLNNAEASVRPELWSGVSKQVAIKTAAKGMSLFTKSIIGFGIATVTVGTIWVFSFQNENKSKIQQKSKAIIQNTNTTSEESTLQEKKNSIKELSTRSNQVQKISYKSISQSTNLTKQHKLQALEIQPISKQFTEKSLVTNQQVISEKDNKSVVVAQKDNQQDINANSNIVDKKESKTFIGNLPNIFTPNNDSDNDRFHIEIKNVSEFSLTILNERNQVVYKTDNPSFSWDGIDLAGNKVDKGTYIYFFTAKNDLNESISKHASLKIVY